jgi:hypothetical protein
LETRIAPDETMTTAATQHSLFAAPPSTADKSSKPLPEKPSTETQTSEKPERPPIALTTEELIEHIFQSMCKGRRWERELLLGASDQELGRSFGNCWCSGQTIELQFRTEGEPALRAVDAVFKTEILTLSAPEIATHIRRIVEIPQLKSGEERKAALDRLFDDLRHKLRREVLPFIRSLLGEKMPRKTKKSAVPKTGLSEEVASLLLTPDSFTERAVRRTLARITVLLIRQGNHDALAAAKHAVSIIEAATGRWRSAMAYWQDTDQRTSYQTPTRAKHETTSSPERDN